MPRALAIETSSRIGSIAVAQDDRVLAESRGIACVEVDPAILRGEKVMLDTDLAELYGVETRVLIQAVKRNEERFPEDLMFTQTKDRQNWQTRYVIQNPYASSVATCARSFGAYSASSASELVGCPARRYQ